MSAAYEDTVSLIRAAQAGDEHAADLLTIENMALVRSIAKRFINRGCDYDDLVQIGSLGLIKAIRNFDPGYGTQFSTYAVPMIAGEIKRFLRDDGMLKVSRRLKELAYKAAAANEKLTAILGRSPRIDEIALSLGVSVQDVTEALDAMAPTCSIYEPVFGQDSDTTRADIIPSEESMEACAADRVMLQEMLGKLAPRDRKLIWLRYFCDKTQSEVARELGISQVQVSRLESRIIGTLRKAAADTAV